MKYNKLLITLLLGLFLISFASAGLLQGNLKFNKINKLPQQARAYGQYELHENGFLGLLRGDTIQTYTLLSSENSVINAQATLEVTNYRPEKLLDSLSFKGGNLRDLKLSYLVNESYQIQNYKQVCSKDTISLNGTVQKNCRQVKNGKTTKYKEVWKDYDKRVLPKGTYQLKIQGKLPKVNNAVDWILNKNGESLDSWLWWNSSWEYKREINLTANAGQFSYLATINYSANMNSDFSDIRFVNGAEDTEFKYTIEKKTDGVSATVRIYSQGETTFYMYYGNSGATTTSSASDTYFNPISYYYLDGNTNDAVGTNDGTNNGATSTTGKIGGAYNFVGSDYISYTTPITSNTWTISGWVKTDDNSKRIILASGGAGSPNQGFWVGVELDGKIMFSTYGGGTLKGTTTINNNEWYFLTFTYDNGVEKIYLNGILEGSLSFTTQGKPTLINKLSWASSYGYGIYDEIGFYNKVLTSTQISDLYQQTAPTYTVGSEQIQKGLTINLNSPSNNTNFTTQNINFVANVTPAGDGSVGITNVSLLINGQINDTNTSGTQGIYNFSETLGDGDYNWSVIAYGNDSIQYNATDGTLDFSIDSTKPLITTNASLVIDYQEKNTNLTFYVNNSDTHLSTCWYGLGGVNTTYSCTNNSYSSFQINATSANINNLTLYANDTYGNLNSSSVSWDYKVFENSRTFNSTSFDTAYETVSLNLTANSSLTNVYLNYSGSSIPTTNSNGVWSYSRNLPSSTVGNNLFNWILTYAGTNISSPNYYYQNVTNLTFSHCTSSPYLNISFKDGNSLTPINATIPTSTFDYYLGTGTVNKTLTYSNASANYHYYFCGNSGTRNLYVQPNLQYKQGTDYPQRIWNPSLQTYTSTTTNQILYLLSSTDGIYVTYQVLDGTGNQLSGVNVKATRTISGSTFTVGTGTTDAAGLVTFWMNPDFVHTITFSKSGYTTYTLNQFPTQPSYTVTLGQSTSGGITDYLRGISYSVSPLGQTLESNTNYYFNFSLNSSYWNVSSFGFNLWGDGVPIGGNSSSTINTTTYNLINISTYSLINMSYYWIINGTTTTGTTAWVTFNSNNGTAWSISNFFTDLKTYTSQGIFGINTNTVNLLVFLFIFALVGLISYKFGLANPAIVSGAVFILVLLFDYGLGMINANIFGVSHFPTLFIGLLTLGFIIREVTT